MCHGPSSSGAAHGDGAQIFVSPLPGGAGKDIPQHSNPSTPPILAVVTNSPAPSKAAAAERREEQNK